MGAQWRWNDSWRSKCEYWWRAAEASLAVISSQRFCGRSRSSCGRRQADRAVVAGAPGRREPAATISWTPTMRRAPRRDVDQVYNLAADMGGMGFIENNKAACMLSVLISTNLLQAAVTERRRAALLREFGVCLRRRPPDRPERDGLRESDAYPAMPEDGYGWEKLFSERMARHFREDFGIEHPCRSLPQRLRPDGSWTGGREKAPAALCRKVAECVVTGEHEIEVWGDGEQTRSFMFVDDCVAGHSQADRFRRRRADQHRFVRTRVDQRADRHHQRHRRHHGRSRARPECPTGCARSQQRQHADPRSSRLGAVDVVCAPDSRSPMRGCSTRCESPRRGGVTRPSGRDGTVRAEVSALVVSPPVLGLGGPALPARPGRRARASEACAHARQPPWYCDFADEWEATWPRAARPPDHAARRACVWRAPTVARTRSPSPERAAV